MGMIQKRCPRCKKKRRKAERIKNTRPGKEWVFVQGVGLVCFMCGADLKSSLPSKT